MAAVLYMLYDFPFFGPGTFLKLGIDNESLTPGILMSATVTETKGQNFHRLDVVL